MIFLEKIIRELRKFEIKFNQIFFQPHTKFKCKFAKATTRPQHLENINPQITTAR